MLSCKISHRFRGGSWAQEEADRLMAPQMPFRVEQVSPPPARSLAFLDRVGCGAQGRN